MHEGRVKPLDTVAREEVKQVYGRETIKIHDPREEIEKILDPDTASKAGETKWTVEKWGPVGAFLGWTVRPEFWDDQPFILVDYLPFAGGSWPTRSRRGSRRSPTSRPRPTPRRTACEAGQRPRADRDGAHRVPPRLEAAARGPKTIAELAAKLSEEHKWLTPARARGGEDRRQAIDDRTAVHRAGPASSRTEASNSTPIPQSAERLTEVERRAIEVALRLMTYKAYSGERFSDRRDHPDHAPAHPTRSTWPTRPRRSRTYARRRDVARPAALCKLDELKAISTLLERHPARGSPTTRPRTRSSTPSYHGVAARQLDLGAAQGRCSSRSPKSWSRRRYPESQVKAFLDAYHELEQAESARPATSPRPPPRRSSVVSRAGRGGEPHQVSDGRGDRARDPVQRDQPVLAGAVRLWRGPGAPGA